METRWTIIDNHLCLSDNRKIYHPSATDIYSLLTGATKIGDITCCNPSEEMTSLRFSKIGTSVCLQLENDSDGNIILNLYANRRGKLCKVDIVDGNIVDQCVSDNVWFFITGTVNIIQNIISNANIRTCGIITLKQYLKVIEQGLSCADGIVVNKVDSKFLQKPLIQESVVPAQLKATLYPYQVSGYLWIKTMLDTNDGCILGDEMGLGKTMQVITEMLYLQQGKSTPVLVVAPISLLVNWQRECAKFAPSLQTVLHYGGQRISNYRKFLDYDVVITSYTTVVSDIHLLNMVQWSLVVLDEAQSIKNPYSARTKACKAINRSRSLAVSGTPFENHVSDIWSLLDFIQPGLLGSLENFKQAITDDVNGGEKIEPILSSLMVRRLVLDVAKDLPDKVVSTQPLQMSEMESEQYCQYLEHLKASYDTNNPNLGMLQQLRVYCTHPYAVSDNYCDNDPLEVSVKYQRLCEIVDEIISRNEKVLVFTSYKRMFDIFKRDIPQRFSIRLWTINGETPVAERQEIVDRFNQLDGSAMLVLNPRAAGTGLNITGANHVIHYNLEWNPSLEDQSSARAYRRGQKNTVFVYRLYYTNTVEEVVNDRIERKRDIASHAIVGNDGESQDRADILKALELIPTIKN